MRAIFWNAQRARCNDAPTSLSRDRGIDYSSSATLILMFLWIPYSNVQGKSLLTPVHLNRAIVRKIKMGATDKQNMIEGSNFVSRSGLLSLYIC